MRGTSGNHSEEDAKHANAIHFSPRPGVSKHLNMNHLKIEKPSKITALGVVLCLLIAGCASVPNIEVDRNAANQIKSIAVLAIHQPHNVQVANIGGAAGAFGLVGGLIQGGTNADHSKQFVDVLNKQKTPLAETLLTALEQSVKEDGFDVSVERVQKVKVAADGKSDDYTDIHVDADAILSVWFAAVGYISPPNSTHYVPWVAIKARLLDAKTKKDIYYKTFCVGYEMKIEHAVMLPADHKYRYASFDELMAHINDAIAGLLSSEEIAAKRIGQDLKR